APLAEFGAQLLGIQRHVIHTPDGDFLIDPLSRLATRLEATGRYEPYVADALALITKPGDLVLDVGANEGYHTVVAARLVGPTGRVIAVEPQQRLHSIIRHNCRLNGVE